MVILMDSLVEHMALVSGNGEASMKYLVHAGQIEHQVSLPHLALTLSCI